MLHGQQVLIEQHIGGLPKIDDYGIQGQVDLASRGPHGVRIVDWKMGSSVGDDESLQLVIYARWAMTKFAVPADEIIVQRVFLGDGTIEAEWRLDQHAIRRGWARLVQDIEGMRQLDEYGRTGVMDAFTPCGKERVCRQCKFQEICEARSSGPALRPISAWLVEETTVS
jgi:hypothetical protein